MNLEQEEKLNAPPGTQYDAGQGTTRGAGRILSQFDEGPCRPSLRERVDQQCCYARNESRRARRLDELARLLDKNPEVARILDLMEELRG